MKLSVFVLSYILLCSMIFPDEKYYSSNKIGMALSPIPIYRTDEYDYVLKIDTDRLKETRRLIKKGEEIQREELLHSRSGRLITKKTYEKGKLKEAEYFNGTGQIQKNELYKDGKLTEKEIFSYLKGRIDKKYVYDSNDNLLYTDLYTISRKGMLIKLVRRAGGITASRTMIIGDSGGIADELTNYADRTNIVRYNFSGKVIETEEWNKNREVIRKTIKRAEKTGKIESVLENDYEKNTTTAEKYNSKEKLIYKKAVDNTGIVYEEWYTRDEKGRIVKLMRRSRSRGDEEWIYSYGSGDTITEEKYEFHGALQKATLYIDDSHRVEKFYRKGEEFIRIYYEEGKKFKEEIIKKGKVIRERDLKTK